MTEKSIYQAIGRRIKEARNQLGITQTELARRIGGNTKQQNVRSWERGGKPRDTKIVSDALQVSEAWLLTGITDTQPEETTTKIEQAYSKSRIETAKPFWPFSITPEAFDQLPDPIKNEIDTILLKKFMEFKADDKNLKCFADSKKSA